MRIAYVNHGRFPTEKAHGFQIAQVCDALTELGHSVTLFCPTFKNVITEEPKKYYGLRHALHCHHLEHYDAFRSSFIPGFLGFRVSMHSYRVAVQRALKTSSFDLAYVRSPLLLPAVLRTNIPVMLELHALPRFARRRFVHGCNQCKRIICLTTPMKEELVRWGVTSDRVIVEADGVDLRRFSHLQKTDDAKRIWNLPHNRPVVGYVGSLATREFLEKGVRELIDASRGFLGLTWIVGGPIKWQKVYEEHAKNKGLGKDQVQFEGRIPVSEVPSAIAACDVCVYPAPKSNHPYFLRDTSPLKLFEYLAAGRPVVCADIPPIRDVVDERSVKFFPPGDSVALAHAVTAVLQHPVETAERVAEGKRIAARHSWEERMKRVIMKP